MSWSLFFDHSSVSLSGGIIIEDINLVCKHSPTSVVGHFISLIIDIGRHAEFKLPIREQVKKLLKACT